MNRKSYKELSQQPAWGCYKSGKIVAAIRAETLKEAIDICTKHGYYGHVKKLPNVK